MTTALTVAASLHAVARGHVAQQAIAVAAACRRQQLQQHGSSMSAADTRRGPPPYHRAALSIHPGHLQLQQ